jgi:hypothetical protein
VIAAKKGCAHVVSHPIPTRLLHMTPCVGTDNGPARPKLLIVSDNWESQPERIGESSHRETLKPRFSIRAASALPECPV